LHKFHSKNLKYIKQLISRKLQLKFQLSLFCIKFWPFEEIPIFSICGHLGWRSDIHRPSKDYPSLKKSAKHILFQQRGLGLGLWYLTPLSTIPLYHGGKFYWWGKPENWRKALTCRKSLKNLIIKCCIKYTSPWVVFELTTLVVISTDCTGSCKSNNHTIMTTAPDFSKSLTYVITFIKMELLLKFHLIWRKKCGFIDSLCECYPHMIYL
jgi:hypothetical protein